ncbi:MAG: hypothetical protein V4737_10200 [Curtobacterium sp.]
MRSKIAADILRDVSRGVFSAYLKVTSNEGNRPVVVANHDERVSVVLQRVRWSGGRSNLFVINRDHSVTLASVLSPEDLLDPDAPERLDDDAVHDDSTIGMLLEVARRTDGGVSTRVRLTSGDAEVRQEVEELPLARR